MSSFFWGSILVLLGLQLIVQALLGINLPLLRVAFACLIIYWGLTLLTGQWDSPLQMYYSHKNVKYTNTSATDSYNTVFGSQYIDLSDTSIDNPQTMTVNASFGNAKVTLNPDVPTRINANATFGTVKLPDGSSVNNTSYVYYTHSTSYKPVLIINANTTFGTITFKE